MLHIANQRRCEQFERIRQNIGDNDLVLRAMRHRIRQDEVRLRGVEFCIVLRALHRLPINVGAKHIARAHFFRGNR